MSIRRLPDDVAVKIRASAAVTSLNQVAAGLVRNSLDAAATRVHVRLDYARGSCTVEDNGLGIEPREFRPEGGLGKPHHTSRCPPSPCFHGSRGDFLASVASLSLLSVVSHHQRHVSQGFLSMHNSKVLARQVPASPEHRLEAFSHGTRVSVHALFGSMPVRVKHQAAVFAGRAAIDKEWGLLVREIAALLLAWPSEVSVCLTETAARRELRLKSTAHIDALVRTSRLFTQAGLADSDDADSWRPVSATARHIRIKGCISTTPVTTRRSQTMSLGIQPILSTQDNNVLYEAVNDVFKNSSFGVDEDTADASDSAGLHLKRRKCLERWPMFYLQILLPSADMTAVRGVLDDSHAVFGDILELLRAVSYEFLKKQNLRPRAIATPTDSATKTAARVKPGTQRSSLSTEPKRARLSAQGPLTNGGARSGSPFDGWNRVKVGWAAPRSKERGASGGQTRQPAELPTNGRRLIGEGGKLLGAPFQDTALPEARAGQDGRPGNEADKESSQPPSKTSGELPVSLKGLQRTRALASRTRPQPSEWLQGVLQSWENPVFETGQVAIPSLYENTVPTGAAHACSDNGQVLFEAGSMSLAGRLSRSALGGAQVIAQVDCKFILVRLPLESASESDKDSSSALVMIDQHAADERCRLEELLQGYFADKPGTDRSQAIVETLEQPVVFEVAGREAELLERYGEHFEAWGIRYKMQRGPRRDAPCEVRVTGLPPSILERCRSEPRVLIELVRKETWTLADDDVLSRPRDAGESWTSRFRGCPSGILELLHSRSCRSKRPCPPGRIPLTFSARAPSCSTTSCRGTSAGSWCGGCHDARSRSSAPMDDRAWCRWPTWEREPGAPGATGRRSGRRGGRGGRQTTAGSRAPWHRCTMTRRRARTFSKQAVGTRGTPADGPCSPSMP